MRMRAILNRPRKIVKKENQSRLRMMRWCQDIQPASAAKLSSMSRQIIRAIVNGIQVFNFSPHFLKFYSVLIQS